MRFTLTSTAVGGATFDFYISPTGSDANPGTQGSPWAITAINTKRATYSPGGVGKSIGLLSGTYDISALMSTSRDLPALDVEGGTSGFPVVIKSVTPRGAVITAGGATPYNIVNAMIGHTTARQQGYFTIDGLYVTGGRTNIIEIGTYAVSSNIAGITIQNNEITGNSDLNSNPGGGNTPGSGGGNASGVTLNNCLNALVTNNYIHDNVGHTAGSADHLSGVLVWLSRGTTIQYNTIISAGYSIYGKETVNQGTTIQNNYCDIGSLTADQGQLYAFPGSPTAGLTDTSIVRNNIVISYAGANLRDNLDLGGWSTNLEFYNNTLIGPITNAGLSAFSKASVTRNIKVYNNLCHDNGTAAAGYGWVCLSLSAAGTIDYNLYGTARFTTVPDGNYTTTTTTSYSTLASWQAAMAGSTGAEAHSSIAAPTFTNTGARALQYGTTSGNAFNTGKVGGVVGGGTLNIGAWDGVVTQIGCNF